MRLRQQEELRRIEGKLQWEGDLNTVRTDKCLLSPPACGFDFFCGMTTPQAQRLGALLSSELLAVGDLILTEVLQGFSNEKDFNQARRLLTSLEFLELGIPGRRSTNRTSTRKP